MPEPLQVQFAPLSQAPHGTLMLLAGEELAFGAAARGFDERTKGMLMRAAGAAGFSGKSKTSIEVFAPTGIAAQRLIVEGLDLRFELVDLLDRLAQGFDHAVIGRAEQPAGKVPEHA